MIFAGVYYQRDKTRMNENNGHQPKKRNENGQMPNNICGDLESSIIGKHMHVGISAYSIFYVILVSSDNLYLLSA